MPSDNSERVEVNTGPSVPKKNDVDSFAALILAMEDAAKHGRAYLRSGSIGAARKMLNERMILKSLAAGQPLPRMEAKMMASIHPLDAEQRMQALRLLEEADGETDLP